MSGTSSSITLNLFIASPEDSDPDKAIEHVFNIIGHELAESYGFKSGYGDMSKEDKYEYWKGFLLHNHLADDFEKNVYFFDDISAYKKILSCLMAEYPATTQAYFALFYRITDDGYYIHDTFNKNVIATRTACGIKYHLHEEVKTVEETEI